MATCQEVKNRVKFKRTSNLFLAAVLVPHGLLAHAHTLQPLARHFEWPFEGAGLKPYPESVEPRFDLSLSSRDLSFCIDHTAAH